MSFEIINGNVTITLTTKKNKEIEIPIIEELDTGAPFCHIGSAGEIPPFFEDVKTITDFSGLVNNFYGDGYGDDVLKRVRSELSTDDEIREFTIEENVETEYEESICSVIAFDLSDFSVSINRTWKADYNFEEEWVVYCLKPFDSSLDKKVIAKYAMTGKNAPTEKRKMGDKVYFLYCANSGLAVIYGTGEMWDILAGWESKGVLDEYEISELIIDSGVENICYHLVYDSYKKIKKVTIADTVNDFEEEALGEYCIEKIVGRKGSAAEKYANENGIDFEALSSEMRAENEDDKTDEKPVKATAKNTPTKKIPESSVVFEPTKPKTLQVNNIQDEVKTENHFEGQMSGEQMKESAFAEVFETIIDKFTFAEDENQKSFRRNHFYDNYHSCVFLFLLLQAGFKETGRGTRETTSIVTDEKFKNVIGLTNIEIGIVMEIKSIVNGLLASGDEDGVAKTLLNSSIMIAVMEKDLYKRIANEVDVVCPELSVSVEILRNELDMFEKKFNGMISDVVPVSADVDNEVDKEPDETCGEFTEENVDEIETSTKVELSLVSESAKSSDVPSNVTEKSIEENKILADGFEIDSVGTLIEYTGNAKDIVIPDAITKIGEYAFSFKENLSSVVLPEGVEIIENNAFNGCTKLVDIVLPSTIRVIDEGAFESCWELKIIVIPDGCKEIGSHCFFDSTELNDIYVPNSVCVIGDNAFDTMNDSTTIHTPSGSFAESFAKENGLNVDNKVAPNKGEVSTKLGGPKANKISDVNTINKYAIELEEEYPSLSQGITATMTEFSKSEDMLHDYYEQSDEDAGDKENDEDDFDPVAAEKAKAEIMDAVSDITASLDSILEKTKAMAEEARQREQAEIDEATKRGKYIPIEFKPNNIFSKEFAELLEQGKPYPKYSENDFETFVRRVKEIIASDISDVPEDVLYIEILGWYTDSVEYNSEKIVKLWNNYLRSLKGEETDFSTWQIDLWGISACDAIDAALFELDNKFWLNGFVSEDEDFEIDAKGLLKKYNGTASNIVLPEGVTQFASGKFYNQNKKISNITSFTLPSSLKKLDIQSEVPFPKMKSLSRVDVSADNEVFSSFDGVLFSKDGTELIYYPVAKRAEEYKVPATVTKIRSGAFARNHYIKKLIISGNVVDTGENNFCNCTSLVTVIFENGVKIIGKNSFAECTSLQEVFVAESVEKLLMATFVKCAGIKTIYACEGSKAIVNAEKLSTKLGAKLIVCKPGQVYDDVSVKPEKQETKTVTKSTANSVQAAQPDTQPQQSTTTVKSQSKANNGTVSAPPPVAEKTAEQPKKSGCYVATAVYGSYDCPEVWTLRRFRDYSLAASLLGRLFIMLYYAISPTLVKWFGNTEWFKKIWKTVLDKMVDKLQQKGFENTPYED